MQKLYQITFNWSKTDRYYMDVVSCLSIIQNVICNMCNPFNGRFIFNVYKLWCNSRESEMCVWWMIFQFDRFTRKLHWLLSIKIYLHGLVELWLLCNQSKMFHGIIGWITGVINQMPNTSAKWILCFELGHRLLLVTELYCTKYRKRRCVIKIPFDS